MERNIPRDASESIDFYMRTIYSVLRSKSETRISGLEEVYMAMDSTMHHKSRSAAPDYNAFIYSILRVPECLIKVQKLVLGQNSRIFHSRGYADIENWEPVSAPARRRFWRFDGKETLAIFIDSKSDIEDIVPLITAFQIEWNKLHQLLQKVDNDMIFAAFLKKDHEAISALANALLSSEEDLLRLNAIWKDNTVDWIREIRSRSSAIRIKLLDSSMIQYSRTALSWMDEILEQVPELREAPVYFVSSNMHSLTNMAAGYALRKEDELLCYLHRENEAALSEEWTRITTQNAWEGKENFLYYILKKYQQSSYGRYTLREQSEEEKSLGICRLPISDSVDVGVQIISLRGLDFKKMDPRIRVPEAELLTKSNAYLLNIDYPLGMAAYHLFSKITEKLENICGVYVMGKAASLNGVRGDVVIPTVVHDMHSSNLYLFQNVFTAADVEPWLCHGSILDNQRAVSVYGTFLQNDSFMNAVYRGGFTDVEMEAGPYLSAIYEMFRPQRHPEDELVDLNNIRMDVGFLHYVSDTPMNKGTNLGAGTLSYFGMDSTYAISAAILRRIFNRELENIRGARV